MDLNTGIPYAVSMAVVEHGGHHGAGHVLRLPAFRRRKAHALFHEPGQSGLVHQRVPPEDFFRFFKLLLGAARVRVAQLGGALLFGVFVAVQLGGAPDRREHPFFVRRHDVEDGLPDEPRSLDFFRRPHATRQGAALPLGDRDERRHVVDRRSRVAGLRLGELICLASEFALVRSRHSSRSLVVLRMASSIGAMARTPLHASSMARMEAGPSPQSASKSCETTATTTTTKPKM